MAQNAVVSNTQEELDALLAQQRAAQQVAPQRPRLPSLGDQFGDQPVATGKSYVFPDGTRAATYTDANGRMVMMPVEGTQPSNIPSQADISRFTNKTDWKTSAALGFARGASKLANFASFGYIPTLEERIAKDRNIPVEAVTKLLEGGIQANPTAGKVSEFAGEALPAVAAGGIGGGLLRLGAAGLRTAIPAAAEALGAETVMAPVFRAGAETGLQRAALAPTAWNVTKELASRAPGAVWSAATSPAAKYGAGLGAAVLGAEMTSMGRTPNYASLEAQDAQAQPPQNVVNLQGGGQAQFVRDEQGVTRLVPLQPTGGMPAGNAPQTAAGAPQGGDVGRFATGEDTLSRMQSPVMEDRAEAYARYYGIPYELVLQEMKNGGVTSNLITQLRPQAPNPKDAPKVQEIAGRLALRLMDQKYQGISQLNPAELSGDQLTEYQKNQRQLMNELLMLAKVNPDALDMLGLK